MATSNDSVSANTGNPSNFQSANSRLIQSFPRHDTVKLDESNFVQWQHHISLIVEGYELTGFLDGTLPAPPRFIQSQEGPLVPNPEASLFHQQDKLRASWLFSSSPLLSYFTNARSACDVWTTATRLFAAATGAKFALIEPSGSRVSEVDRVEIILVGLPLEYDAILTLASFSAEPLPLRRLIDMLLEYENRQSRVVQDGLFHVNGGGSSKKESDFTYCIYYEKDFFSEKKNHSRA
ncbi:hypothetical protein Gotri_019797 [Gossypium trilobum]|uniref:Retrotransposon Copia-like N-terminal domain-containing protein n=1 Tax=Gossypium trilobum TaxID=34281 RepID=A0A7J9EFN8_9ROSI|nr:hypothetical protein [Gossypium trilobum]